MSEEQIAVLEGSGNVFADLGFPDADEMLAKATMVSRLLDIIAALGLPQAQVAALLGIDQQQVSALMRGQLERFSLGRVLSFLLALDHDVDIIVRPKEDDHPHLKVIAS